MWLDAFFDANQRSISLSLNFNLSSSTACFDAVGWAAGRATSL